MTVIVQVRLVEITLALPQPIRLTGQTIAARDYTIVEVVVALSLIAGVFALTGLLPVLLT